MNIIEFRLNLICDYPEFQLFIGYQEFWFSSSSILSIFSI